MELKVPRMRDGGYFPSLLEPPRRAERALSVVAQEEYVHGDSTRKVDEELAKALGRGWGHRAIRHSGYHLRLSVPGFSRRKRRRICSVSPSKRLSTGSRTEKIQAERTPGAHFRIAIEDFSSLTTMKKRRRRRKSRQSGRYSGLQ